MIRRWVLAGVTMAIFLSGCATDDRRAQINVTLNLLDETKSKIKKLREEIASATDRIGADKKLNLSQAIKEAENLKDFCSKQVQRQALVMQSWKTPLSVTEKAQFKSEFEGRVNSKMQDLDKETLELEAAIKKLEETVATQDFEPPTAREDAKKEIEDLKKKLDEAKAEFESLNRKA